MYAHIMMDVFTWLILIHTYINNSYIYRVSTWKIVEVYLRFSAFHVEEGKLREHVHHVLLRVGEQPGTKTKVLWL